MNAAALLNDAIAAMAKLHDSMTPDERAENAIVPPAAVREFVDAHARLLYERNRMPPNDALRQVAERLADAAALVLMRAAEQPGPFKTLIDGGSLSEALEAYKTFKEGE